MKMICHFFRLNRILGGRMEKGCIYCPKCQEFKVRKYGKTSNQKQRYICLNKICSKVTFVGLYSKLGYSPEVKEKISEMLLQGCGIRQIARTLEITPNTVLKQKKILNTPLKNKDDSEVVPIPLQSVI